MTSRHLAILISCCLLAPIGCTPTPVPELKASLDLKLTPKWKPKAQLPAFSYFPIDVVFCQEASL